MQKLWNSHLYIYLIVRILDEICQMLSLYEDSIKVSVRQSNAKLNFLRIGQMYVLLELGSCVWHHIRSKTMGTDRGAK